jgi:16S rRNA (guanine966-N2)-methyltransferase
MGWLAPGALAVVEIAAREELSPPAGVAAIDERIYGAAQLVFLRYNSAATGGVG